MRQCGEGVLHALPAVSPLTRPSDDIRSHPKASTRKRCARRFGWIRGSLYVVLRRGMVLVRALTDARASPQMAAAISMSLAGSVLPVRATRAARTNKVQLSSCKSVLNPYPAPKPSDDARLAYGRPRYPIRVRMDRGERPPAATGHADIISGLTWCPPLGRSLCDRNDISIHHGELARDARALHGGL